MGADYIPANSYFPLTGALPLGSQERTEQKNCQPGAARCPAASRAFCPPAEHTLLVLLPEHSTRRGDGYSTQPYPDSPSPPSDCGVPVFQAFRSLDFRGLRQVDPSLLPNAICTRRFEVWDGQTPAGRRAVAPKSANTALRKRGTFPPRQGKHNFALLN